VDHALERQIIGKVTRRLIPFLFVLYVFAYLDRVNVGMAALTMKADLGFSERVYGFGAGIFFIGYFIFEVPSNLILARMGARVWIARIMITWGVISSAMLWTTTPSVFYTLRFLLGAAEAGFFPGIIYYLTNWFPAVQRARAVSRFMMAIQIAGILGGPLGGVLLGLDGLGGLRGWQWLFLLEGLPSVLLGFATLLYLTDSPEQASWLAPAERAYLIERLRAERATTSHSHLGLLQALAHPRVLVLSALYFCLTVGGYGLTMNLPVIIKSLGALSNLQAGLITAVPYVCAAISMLLVGIHSDRTQERRWHVAVMALVSAAGLAMTALLHDPVLRLAGMAFATLGQASTLAPFWALGTTFLTGTAAAGAIAFINSVGNLGGFAGPFLMGWIKDATGSFTAALLALSALVGSAAVLAASIRPERAPERRERIVEPERAAGGASSARSRPGA
jgi:D-galactonate transporter